VDGIVAGFQHALAAVGFPVPSERELRSDVGPPVGTLFTSLGVEDAHLGDAVAAYRSFYAQHGLHRASVYPGIHALLDGLAQRGLTLGTATAKLTPVAQAILERHGLADRFAVINGTDATHHTKAETLTRTLELLGGPDPASVVMVGDRHSDISAAQACGVVSVGVRWGYGTAEELEATGADHLVGTPAELLALIT
jgi:phosphoglycolate phosphatase